MPAWWGCADLSHLRSRSVLILIAQMADRGASGAQCSICNHFQGKWPIESHKSLEGPWKGTRHHKADFTWDNLRQSADSCYCCDILLEGTHGCFRRQGIQESEIEHGSLLFLYPYALDEVEEASSMKSLLFTMKNGRKFEIEMFASDDDACPIPDSWDYILVSPRMAPRSDSKQALATIKKWMTECIETHGDSHDSPAFCESPCSSKLPTRVVDVGSDNDSIKLVEPREEQGHYICLSHCWGKEQIITTTKSTIEKRRCGIP